MKKGVELSNKFALLLEGKRLTDYIFDEVICDKNDVLILKAGDSIFWFDAKTGEKLNKVAKVKSYIVSSEYSVICKGSLYGAYSYDGKNILPNEYEEIKTFKDSDYAVVTKGGLKGVFSLKNSKWIIPIEYDDILLQGNWFNYWEVRKGFNNIGAYTYNGEKIESTDFLHLLSFNYKIRNM